MKFTLSCAEKLQFVAAFAQSENEITSFTGVEIVSLRSWLAHKTDHFVEYRSLHLHSTKHSRAYKHAWCWAAHMSAKQQQQEEIKFKVLSYMNKNTQVRIFNFQNNTNCVCV